MSTEETGFMKMFEIGQQGKYAVVRSEGESVDQTPKAPYKHPWRIENIQLQPRAF